MTNVLWNALTATGAALNVERCWLHRKSFHFMLSDDLSVAITPDTADRLRVEVFRGLTRLPDRTTWVLRGDCDRLVEIVSDLAGEVNGDLQEIK